LIRRQVRVKLSAQLRIDKRSTLEYFQLLKRAGFGRVRFGVDGWTDHTLQLQRKGYNMALVEQNLRDCAAAGLTGEVNLVVGVPGETEEDVEATIANLIRCKPFFSAVEYINPLYLRCGSEYFRAADEHHIHFRVPRETIYCDYGSCVPHELWYSEAPYIDEQVRLERIERICAALKANGVTIGTPAMALTERLKLPGAYLDEGGEVRVRKG
jgi:histone acetyltransferase (RNA polymerase elongator complex component)